MTRSGTRLLLTATAASCAAFLVCFPRAVEPRELPALVFDRSAVRAALDADAAAAGESAGDDAARAREADRAERALDASLASRTRSPELDLATRYGIVREGRRMAPRIVARAVFKARWNTAHGRDEADGLVAIERQAYFGWIALGPAAVPVEVRADALEAYGHAGGPAYDEALAVLHAVRGHDGDAFLRFSARFRATGALRDRNHARWAAPALD